MPSFSRHSPFYSAPSIIAVLRNLVEEIWLEKSGSRKVVDQKKKVFLYHKSTFFLVGEKWLARKKIWACRTTFLEPLFYTFLENWLQNKWSNRSFNLRPNFSFEKSRCRLSKRADYRVLFLHNLSKQWAQDAFFITIAFHLNKGLAPLLYDL